jgi:general secretion pathway protein D
VLKSLQIIVLGLTAALLCAGADTAARLFEAGEKAAKRGDDLQAFLLFSQAAKLDPGNNLYAQRRAVAQGTATSTPVQLGPEVTQSVITTLQADRPEAPELLAEPAPSLAPNPGRQSFDLRGSANELFEKVAGAYGIQVVMDRDYRSPAPSLRFRIEDATAVEALRVLEAATDSFVTPLGEHAAIVARDTAQKRTELTPVTAIAVPIPERLSVQEGQDISTAVQQTLEIKRVSLDAGKRIVYFRDTQAKALAARQMFANLSRLRAQIEVDVQFISVGKTSNLSYGLSLPNSGFLVDFGNVLGNSITQAGNFFLFGGGSTLMGLGVANAVAFATVSDSSASTLLESQIVAVDGQSATLKVGSRYPIITASYTSGVAGSSADTAGLSPPIEFIDLGLTLKVTPVVHADMEVTLDVDAEFKTLGNGLVNGIPVISNQQFQGKVRLKDGEWAVIAGLLTTNDSQTPTGIAGLSEIPILGRLFTHQTHEKDRNDTLIILKPHLVALPPWETATPALWTGTETHPLTAF